MVGCTGQYFVMKYMSLQKEMQRCAFAGMQHRDAAQGCTQAGVVQWQNPTKMSPKQKAEAPLRHPPYLTHQLLPLGSDYQQQQSPRCALC